MKPEVQQIAIAEACKWRWNKRSIWTPSGGCFARYATPPPADDLLLKTLPDYPNDLNAMHEAEKLLDEHDENRSIPMQDANWRSCYGHLLVQITGFSNPFHATAAQRAEAFLRVLGKWVEGEQ